MPLGKETPPLAASARPLAATAQLANVTQDAARSRASTGAPTSPTDGTVASLPGVGALAEPAKELVGIDATQSVAEASPSATTTPLAPVDKAATIPTQDIDGDDSSQPPPDPPANTARTRTVNFDDTTEKEDAPAAGGAPDDPDDDDEKDDKDWTAIYIMEQQADLADYVVASTGFTETTRTAMLASTCQAASSAMYSGKLVGLRSCNWRPQPIWF